ncbi:hypothetical protein [Ensifer sp. 4252]|uniref:hypothetical protein n=1 Tax=Ensifer sp. 4252 TaxID=3373915 RepID=UPI003D2333F8
MQIYGFFSNASATRTPTAGSPTGIDAAPLEQKSGSSLLNLLRTDDETAANRKAIAKKKLDELKQQMQMLRFWASDPETLARLAKQLAQQLGAAAQQFAGGGSAGMTGGGDAAAGAASAATTAASAASEMMQVSADETANDGGEESKSQDKTGPSSFAERAYREFGSDRSEDSSDARTIAEFKALAEQLEQVLRKAEQDLRAKGAASDADDARKASASLGKSIASLDSTGIAGMAARATAIPTSISM